jgi:glycosyltransferase involved in cell wall biosynthesis
MADAEAQRMTFQDFRRRPRVVIKRRSPASMKKLLVSIYERIDRNGVLSDLLADPQILYERYWPYRFFRSSWSQSDTRLVSVVVATRNNGRTLRASLQSLLDQTLKNIEIVVVDDASTDEAPAILAEIQAQDPRVRVIRNTAHLGTGASRNIGMRHARGDYLTFQDGDDFSNPSRLERQLRALKEHPSKKFVTCNYVRIDENRQRLEINNKRVMSCNISMMFPREEVIEKVGFFIEQNVSEDADFYERLKIYFGPDSELVLFRTLYEALFREDSSFFSSCDMVRRKGRKVVFKRNPAIVAEWEKLKSRHEEMRQALPEGAKLRQASANFR